MDVSFDIFKSLAESDGCPIVVCNPKHTIIYMNPAAKMNYAKRGGEKLVGSSVLSCHSPASAKKIEEVVNWFAADKSNNRVHTFYSAERNKDVYMIALRDDSGELIGYYEKHEYRTPDTTPFYKLG